MKVNILHGKRSLTILCVLIEQKKPITLSSFTKRGEVLLFGLQDRFCFVKYFLLFMSFTYHMSAELVWIPSGYTDRKGSRNRVTQTL